MVVRDRVLVATPTWLERRRGTSRVDESRELVPSTTHLGLSRWGSPAGDDRLGTDSSPPLGECGDGKATQAAGASIASSNPSVAMPAASAFSGGEGERLSRPASSAGAASTSRRRSFSRAAGRPTPEVAEVTPQVSKGGRTHSS